ncbi:methyltransferase domain-containing protein [Actinocorallia sp. A-T 12471]|uniref:methyltransferase domain-containing protein n=1 Tax=Actinocorallia sp. A-T 12471 TaxID=3089813 RepID=UPI0029CD1546|nr:methyltransferase domain-containing protein [Actinocorallia sp. A-T 12471]MDX6742522.1 methyltransferase domain-containing protein [Actinocorallia sp. A-T 12471]
MRFVYGEVGLPVDRRLFVPETIYVREGGWLVPLRRSERPEEWERLVGMDDAVTTRTDEGEPRLSGVVYPAGKGFFPTSSSSAPGVMARMIRALDVRPGMRVLEIGTGTGYNAACLAALGCEVVSVEIERDLAERARASLEAAGVGGVVVVCGDGELGVPGCAPFDRVVATAAAHTIPYAWVEQTRDEGLIVAPYTGEAHRAALLVLRVHDGTAIGGMEGGAGFMPLRGQGLEPAVVNAIEDRVGVRVEVTRGGQRVWGDC